MQIEAYECYLYHRLTLACWFACRHGCILFHRFWKPSHAQFKKASKNRNCKIIFFYFPFPIFVHHIFLFLLFPSFLLIFALFLPFSLFFFPPFLKVSKFILKSRWERKMEIYTTLLVAECSENCHGSYLKISSDYGDQNFGCDLSLSLDLSRDLSFLFT